MLRSICAAILACLAIGCTPAPAKPAPPLPKTLPPAIVSAAPAVSASAVASIAADPEPAELPSDPVFDWLAGIDPDKLGGQVIFDPALGVRYASSAVSMSDGERAQAARLLCDAKEIAELTRDVVARRRGPNGELARCDETPTSARCFLVGWHDAPNHTIELRRPSPTTYLIVSIESAGMSWGEAPNPDESFTALALTRLRAKRCPRK